MESARRRAPENDPMGAQQSRIEQRRQSVFGDRVVAPRGLQSLRATGVLLLLATTPISFAAEIFCPPQIQVQEKIATEAPDGWTARTADPVRYLGGVTVFDGDPVEQVSLVPDIDRRAAGKDRIATWKFVKPRNPIWLACSYNGTAITVVKPLPAGVRACAQTDSPGIIIKKISCE